MATTETRTRRGALTALLAVASLGTALIPASAHASAGTGLSVTYDISGTPSAQGWYSDVEDVTVHVDGESVESGSWSLDSGDEVQNGSLDTGDTIIPVNAEGLSTLTWSVTADSGRKVSGSASLTIDRSDPVVQMIMPSDGVALQMGGEQPLEFQCSDALSGVVSCLDSNGHASGTMLDTSTKGAKSITVTAVDGSGRASTHTLPYDVFAPDTTPPDVSGERIAGGDAHHGWFTSPVVFRTRAVDPELDHETRTGLKTLFNRVDGQMIDTDQPTRDVTFDTDGHHELSYSATDGAGNPSEVHFFSTDIDKTPPVVEISYPRVDQHLTRSSSKHPVIHCSDATSGVASCDTTVMDMTPGRHDAPVVAADQAGNQRGISHSYVVDAPSSTTITKSAVTSHARGRVTVQVKAYGYPTGVVSVYADGKKIGSCRIDLHRHGSLAAGPVVHTVKVPVSKVKAGMRKLTARYGGSDGALPSKSRTVTVKVT